MGHGKVWRVDRKAGKRFNYILFFFKGISPYFRVAAFFG